MTTTGLRLSLFLGETDVWHHRPLYQKVVRRAREAGLTCSRRSPSGDASVLKEDAFSKTALALKDRTLIVRTER